MRPFSNMTIPRALGSLILVGLLLGGCDDSSAALETQSEADPENDFEEASSPEEETEEQVTTQSPETTPPETKLEMSFSENDSISEGLHWIVEEAENGEFWVNVTAVELTDVYGIAFHLTFEPSVIQYVEGQSTEILRTNQVDVATLFRPGDGVVRFGTVRLHEPLGGGQGLNYTGLDVPKGIIAKFKFPSLAAGETELQIKKEGLDIRNADLDPMNVSVSGTDVSIAEVEVQP